MANTSFKLDGISLMQCFVEVAFLGVVVISRLFNMKPSLR